MKFTLRIIVILTVFAIGYEIEAAPTFLESLTGNDTSISYFLVTSGDVYNLEEDRFIPGNIIYTDGSSIKTSDGKKISVVVGNATGRGYVEGQGASAVFNYIYGFTQVGLDQLVVSDYNNYCIRHVNRTTGNTTQYIGQCGKSGSGQVEFGVDSVIGRPKRVIVDNQLPHHLLFAHTDRNGFYLAHFDMKNKIVGPFGSLSLYVGDFGQMANGDLINTQAFYSSSSRSYYSKVYSLNYHLKLNYVIAGSLSGYSDGVSTSARYNNPRGVGEVAQGISVIADYINNRVRIFNKTSNYTSTLCTGMPRTCSFQKPVSFLVTSDALYIGENKRITKIEVPNVGGSLLEKPEANKSHCPEEIVRKMPSTVGFSTVDIYLADGSPAQLQLPPGVYPIKHRNNDTNCSDITITVAAFDEKVVRRLAFRAEYDVKCASIADEVSQSSLRSITNHNYAQLEEFICEQDCKRQKGANPMTKCDGNTLTVDWTTDLTFSGDADVVPAEIAQKLNKRLIEKGAFLYIFLLQQVPPVVYPRMTKDGASVSLELISSCPDGYKYNSKTDSCY